jgi:hypothetical protein
MAKEPHEDRPSPPRYGEGKGSGHSGSSDTPPDPRQTGTQSQSGPQAPAGQSQKSQIAQYFRSQGRQPDDVILDIGGMQLRLKDLDG